MAEPRTVPTERGVVATTTDGSSNSALAVRMPDASAHPASITDIKSAREGRRTGARERPGRVSRSERVERERGERRANRRNQAIPDALPADPSGESLANPSDALVAPVATVDAPIDGRGDAASKIVEPTAAPTSNAAPSRPVLIAPLVDTGQTNRALDRTRTQLVAAEQAILQSKDVTAAIAPLVRHINTVTERLNESQEQVGRLASERDALRAHLMDVTGMTAEQVASVAVNNTQAVDQRLQQRLTRLDARPELVTPGADSEEKPSAIKRFGDRTGLFIKDEFGPDEIKNVARRRQLLALSLFTFIGVALFVAQYRGMNIGDVSKNGLADMAFIGIFFQMFLMMWMMYRVIRVGGKGAHWLFPDSNGKRRRR